MKVLFNKLKKANKIFLSIYIIIFSLYLVSYIFLVKNLLSLTSIETVIRTIIILLLGIWLIFYFLSNLVKLILKKHIFMAITSSITLILCVILGVVNYYINIVNGSINNLVEKEYVTYTTNLITLNEANINEDSIDNLEYQEALKLARC